MTEREETALRDTAEFHETDFVQFASMAELGLLSASLMHELRQPLMIAKGLLQVGQTKGRLEGRGLQEVLEALAHIAELVEHYSGVGRVSGPAVPYDVNEQVRQTLGMLEPRTRRMGRPVSVTLFEGALRVRGRPLATRQIVLNLLQNALDAVETVAAPSILVQTREHEGQALIVVEDNGAGVPPSLRDRLFEPFVTSKPAGKGTGLGLYIARRLTLQEGGTLQVTHPEARGLRLVVALPLGGS